MSGRRTHYGSQNHLFLYPAMEAHSKEIMDNVKDAISAAINRGK